MQGRFGAHQHQEQLRLVAVESLERLVEGFKDGALSKKGVETGFEVGNAERIRVRPVVLEIGVQVPKLFPDLFNRFPMPLVARDQFVDQAFGMNPAQAMLEHRELAGAIADDRQVSAQTLLQQTPEQGALGGNPTLPRGINAQRVQVALPRVWGIDLAGVMSFQALQGVSGQALLAQVRYRFVSDVVGNRPGVQQFEEIDAALFSRAPGGIGSTGAITRSSWISSCAVLLRLADPGRWFPFPSGLSESFFPAS